MKPVFYLFLPLFLLPLHAESQPNLIVIVADDMGYADMGFLKQAPEDVKKFGTPGFDRLAKTGTYFANGYSTSAICSPSRAGLNTGKYQQRWGNYSYGEGGLPQEEGDHRGDPAGDGIRHV